MQPLSASKNSNNNTFPSMIWQSIKDGMYVLTFWEVWLAALLFALVYHFLDRQISHLLALDYPDVNNDTPKWQTFLLSIPAIQGILAAILVTVLLPIIFGNIYYLDIDFIIDNVFTVLKAGVASIVLVILIGFIPVIGEIVLKISGTTFFVQGLVIVGILQNADIESLMTDPINSENLFPSFLAIVGGFIYSVLLSILSSFIVTGILSWFEKGEKDANTFAVATVISFTAAIVGLISLATYASYIILLQST